MSTFMYLFLFVALILAVGLLNSFRLETHTIKIDKPFDNKWSNLLYRYSFYMPFIWFVDVKEEQRKTKDIKLQIAKANLGHLFNHRSFTVLKVAILITSIVVYSFFLLILDNADFFTKIFFNMNEVKMADETGSNMNTKIVVLMVLLVLNLLPNMLLKRRAELYEFYSMKDIPIIQMFIILMLRSKKPIGEILYALSKINTRYKKTFDIGYRIFLRNKEDGLEYIKETFGESAFKETINVLKDMGEYSREDSIQLLENNMQQLVESNNAMKRRGDLTKLVYSQSTLVVPYLSVILLCLVPLVVYGLDIFGNAGLGF